MAETKSRKARLSSVLSLLIEPYKLKNQGFDKRRVHRLFLSGLMSLGLIIVCIFLDQVLNPYHPTPLFLVILMIYLAITLCTSLIISIIVNDDKIGRTYLFLFALIITAFIFKRLHFPYGSVLIVLSFSIMAISFFIYSIKILITIKNNLYLKIFGTVACVVIWMSSLGILFKYNHWPGASIAIYLSVPTLLIITLIVLLTLPNSGYIKWNKKHRMIFTRKLLLPWLFLLVFTAFKLLLPPEIEKQIFESEISERAPFDMKAYELPEAEGLEKGQ